MSCDACEKMQRGDIVVPHPALALHSNRTKLRPIGRMPVFVWRYSCQVCDTHWLYEFDPAEPTRSEWVCLYQASNILIPVLFLEQRDPSQVSAATSTQGRFANDAEPDLLLPSFT